MNKKIFIILIAVLISMFVFKVAYAQSIPQMSPWRVVSGVIQPTNPNNAVRLSTTTSGCTGISATGELYSTGTACGTGGGGGGSAGGTWSTTTSTVSGQLINYTNNTTDIAAIGSNSTTTAEFFFDPNTNRLAITGAFFLPTTATTSNIAGVVYQNNNRFIHTYADTRSTGDNTFMGKNSGNFTMTTGGGTADLGSYNTGYGAETLQSLTTGQNNTAFGWRAGKSITSGNRNDAIGYIALENLTTGNFNEAIGDAALNVLTTGDGNVAIGYVSGYKLGGASSGNTFIGSYSGYDNVNSNRDSAASDNQGTLIGQRTGRSVASTTALSNYTAIGYDTKVSRSNQVVIGNSNVVETVLRGYTGIGTTSPIARLDIAGENNSSTDLLKISRVSSFATTTKVVVDSLGEVGIGTTSPSTKLSVSSDDSEDMFMLGRGNSTAAWFKVNFNNNYTNFVSNDRYLFKIKSTEYARLETSGFGLGTTSPGTSLSIGNTGNDTINISATATSTFGSGINLRTGCFAVNGVCISGGGGGGSSGPVTTTLEFNSVEPQTDSFDFAPGGGYIQPIYGPTYTNGTSSAMIYDITIPQNVSATPNALLIPWLSATGTPSTGIAVVDFYATTTGSGQNWYTNNFTSVHAASTTAANRFKLTTGTSLPITSTTTISLAGLNLTAGSVLKVRVVRYGADANDTVDNDVFMPKLLLQIDTN